MERTEKPLIGILALQGDFAEHLLSIEAVGARAVEVRYISQLADLDGLVIPGGESTTIAKFNETSDGTIFAEIKRLALLGLPIYGTCMGTVVLANRIESLAGEATSQARLGIMDIAVKRNAYGPQKKSFEAEIAIPDLGGEPFTAIFIRAPQISSCSPNVKIMATINDSVVMARQDNLLVTTFHPEIADDLRVHEYFVTQVVAQSGYRATKSTSTNTESISTKSKDSELMNFAPEVAASR